MNNQPLASGKPIQKKLIQLNVENIATHIDGLCLIEQANFAMPCSKKLYLEEIQNNPNAHYWGITIDDQLVAFGGYWLILAEAEVTNIVVVESYRGLGLGKELVTALLNNCRAQGAVRLSLEVRKSNFIAILLYQGLGFVPLGFRKNYYEDNQEDALIMALNLTATE